MRWYFLLLVFIFWAQSDSKPIVSFISPVKGLMQLTGTFGELRANHFHGGLDIRGHIGRPVYAIADGFVARIRVTVSGYGQAIYLQHPSGHTSVYGHLDRFSKDVAEFVQTQQYTKESFLLDEQPAAEQFPVKQGELIGYIGQRGFVSGPHLHFEIRDTATGRLLNPMNFGIRVPDHRQPAIRALRIFELDEKGNVLSAKNKKVSSLGGGQYSLREDTLFVRQAAIGLGIKTYDQQDGRPNYNGIYQLELSQNDSLVFGFKMDHFAGEQTRFLNAHLDYSEQLKNNSWFHRCFRLPGNELDFYEHNSQNGRITLLEGEHRRLRLNIQDIEGNSAELELIIKRRSNTLNNLAVIPYTYQLPFDQESIIDNKAVRVHFPEGSFYEDLWLDYDLIIENTQGLYSAVHRFQTHTTPVHRYFDLHISPDKIADRLKSKAIITHCEDGKSPTSYGGEWTDEGRLRAPVRDFGNFAIMLDTIPPSVQAHRFSSDMRSWDQFSFQIDDNFPTAGKARDLRFRGEVDGQWILLEYDGRKKRLYHNFDGHIPKGKHQLLLRVIDDRGNETVVKRVFQR